MCPSLMTSDIHAVLYTYWLFVSLFGQILVESSAHFLIGLFGFLILRSLLLCVVWFGLVLGCRVLRLLWI